ncbi:hypothetical protein HN011_011026 [Eciton burchellii]|nr:hypothetical protein HN011_011026 [Eciton burchellii]
MAIALTPLSCTLAYRNGRSLPPPIRSMEVPVSRRLGELRPFPPTMQRQDDVQFQLYGRVDKKEGRRGESGRRVCMVHLYRREPSTCHCTRAPLLGALVRSLASR